MISSATYNNEAPNQYLIRDGTVDFYYKGPQTWRFDYSSEWGDTYLAIESPTELYTDSMVSGPANLLDPLPDPSAMSKVPQIKNRLCILSQFMGGEGKFDDYIVKDSPIIDTKKGDVETIEFKSLVAGFQRMTLKGDDITMIDTIGSMGDTKIPHGRDVITITPNPKLEDWMFTHKPEPGLTVDDQRKKKGK